MQSKKRKEMSGTPESDYFMNEEKSDVLFVVEGKQIPALKAFLSVKSRVFSAMFSGKFKESKYREVIIEDTTYEAFNTFVRFLYFDDSVLKDENDFELIQELYRLSDRYDVSRLKNRITEELANKNFKLFYGPISESDEEFQTNFLTIKSIARIAFESRISILMDNVMTFIRKHFDYLLEKDIKELSELNDLTDGQLFHLMAKKCKSGQKKVKTIECTQGKS